MGKSEFKPTRREVLQVRRIARSVEGHARIARMLGQFAHADNRTQQAHAVARAEACSKLAFAMSQHIAARGQA